MNYRKDCPLVSIVIPVFNRENTILRAINSVLQQTYVNFEIIIVDDCSTDSTVSKIRKCKDERLRLIRLSCNRGANFARNRGIENANGSFIAFQDSDDEWLENKLDIQINYMLNKNLEASFCPYILYNGEYNQIIPNDYQIVELFDKEKIKEKLRKENVVGTPTLIVKKNVFSQVGMFDEEMNRLQDYEFIIRLVKKYDLGYIPLPLVKAHRMEISISTNKKALLDAYTILVKKHSDFIDLEYVIYNTLDYFNICVSESINWSEYDELIECIQKQEPFLTQKNIYKIIIERIYKKYFLVKKMLEDWYMFFCKYIKTKEFVIYGAGFYGKQVYYEMRKQNYIPLYFLVTKKEECLEIDGIEIKELSEFNHKELPVIIAISWERQIDLIKNLQNNGIYRFCIYPFCY